MADVGSNVPSSSKIMVSATVATPVPMSPSYPSPAGGVGAPPLVQQPRRRQAMIDFDSNDDDAAAYSATAREGGPELRDRYRQCFMSLPCKLFHTFVLFATLFLVAISFSNPETTQSAWYHVLEGTVMSIFVTEVFSRMYMARSHFWMNRFNVAEATICLVCLLSFIVMIVSQQGGSTTEHELVMALRYIAQLLRVSIYYQSGMKSMTSGIGSSRGFGPSVAGSGDGDEINLVTVADAAPSPLAPSAAVGTSTPPPAPLTDTSSALPAVQIGFAAPYSAGATARHKRIASGLGARELSS